MVSILPSEDCVFRLDSKYGFSHAANLPVTYTDVTLDDRGFGFNGSSSYVDAGNNASLDLVGDGTVEIWFKSPSITTVDWLVVGKGLVANNGWYLYSDIGTTDINNFTIYNGITRYNFRLGDVFENNIWYHFVFTANSTGRYGYVNGVLIKTDTSVLFQTNNEPLIIGRYNGGTFEFNGYIKNVSIYNRALTAQEVADRYNKYTFGGHL